MAAASGGDDEGDSNDAAKQDLRDWRRVLADQLRQWLETLHRILFIRACVHLEQGLKEQADRGACGTRAFWAGQMYWRASRAGGCVGGRVGGRVGG